MLQHPEQVVGPHAVPPVQTPAVHEAPDWQAVHVEPLTPHEEALCALGDWQTPLLQQPGHERKPQTAVGAQDPIEQEFPGWQAAHAAPLPPHRLADWFPKGMQSVPWQQPLAQFAGVHVATVTH
ncbi:MAG: hypothetical protein INH37_21880 [Myxococcaceae bacterium]|nr:hypothetical protein [Myxococcaceae bacterium]